METLVPDGRDRSELPSGAAPLIDLAVKWMAGTDPPLIGRLAGATVEFTLDKDGRVSGWFAKTRGGRRDLLPVVPDIP